MTRGMTDRDLDAWLSEHLNLVEKVCESCDQPAQWFDDPDQPGVRFGGAASSWHGTHYHLKGGGISTRIPAYSSTGDGALLVLDAMRERGWEYELSSRYDETYQATFYKTERRETAEELLLPYAVAQAAKLALVGVK